MYLRESMMEPGSDYDHMNPTFDLTEYPNESFHLSRDLFGRCVLMNCAICKGRIVRMTLVFTMVQRSLDCATKLIDGLIASLMSRNKSVQLADETCRQQPSASHIVHDEVKTLKLVPK